MLSKAAWGLCGLGAVVWAKGAIDILLGVNKK